MTAAREKPLRMLGVLARDPSAQKGQAMNVHVDLEALRARHLIPDVASSLVKLRRIGNEWIACCPFHDDRSPSFTVFGEGRRYKCFGCGASGDVVDFMQSMYRIGFRDAVAMLENGAFPASFLPKTRVAAANHDRIADALAIWDGAGSVIGTPADRYLRFRRINVPIPPSLRFARLRYGAGGPVYPCLVALFVDADGRPTGIQRTYLDETGAKAKLAKVKLSLGRVAGGAIRLGSASSQVTICEGLEDGLSLVQGGYACVWVVAGASMLSAVKFPAFVGSVIIAADGDFVGEREAQKARAAFLGRGLQVRIIRPLAGFKDFNAALQGKSR